MYYLQETVHAKCSSESEEGCCQERHTMFVFQSWVFAKNSNALRVRLKLSLGSCEYALPSYNTEVIFPIDLTLPEYFFALYTLVSFFLRMKHSFFKDRRENGNVTFHIYLASRSSLKTFYSPCVYRCSASSAAEECNFNLRVELCLEYL